MTTSPDEIRSQIEETRSHLSEDVNQLAGAMTPSQVAARQMDKVKDAVSDVKDKVMGHDDTLTSGRPTGRSATGWVKERTGASPWAAGLIALGAGWLVGSLLPASEAERAVADRVKDTAAPALGDAAGEVADHLKEPAQQAVESVRSATTEAVESVREEGRQGLQETATQLPSASPGGTSSGG